MLYGVFDNVTAVDDDRACPLNANTHPKMVVWAFQFSLVVQFGGGKLGL
jgi:hypothetical protein